MWRYAKKRLKMSKCCADSSFSHRRLRFKRLEEFRITSVVLCTVKGISLDAKRDVDLAVLAALCLYQSWSADREEHIASASSLSVVFALDYARVPMRLAHSNRAQFCECGSQSFADSWSSVCFCSLFGLAVEGERHFIIVRARSLLWLSLLYLEKKNFPTCVCLRKKLLPYSIKDTHCYIFDNKLLQFSFVCSLRAVKSALILNMPMKTHFLFWHTQDQLGAFG